MLRKKSMNISSTLPDVRIGGVGINRIGEDCEEKFFLKELSFCLKSQFYNTYISTTRGCIPVMFQTYIV